MARLWSYDAELVGASDAGSIPASSTTTGLIGFDGVRGSSEDGPVGGVTAIPVNANDNIYELPQAA